MDKEIGSSVNSLLKTDKCSPLVVYIVFAIIAGVTLYNNYNISQKFKSVKVNNILTMHMWYEISFIVILGVLLYGLCSYNHENLAWAVLFAPLVIYIIKLAYVFSSVSSIMKNVPDESMPRKENTQETQITSLVSQVNEPPLNPTQAYEQKQASMNPPLASNNNIPSGFNF
jgi:predicted membrane protein